MALTSICMLALTSLLATHTALSALQGSSSRSAEILHHCGTVRTQKLIYALSSIICLLLLQTVASRVCPLMTCQLMTIVANNLSVENSFAQPMSEHTKIL